MAESLAEKYGVGSNKKVTCRPQHPRHALEVTIKLLECLEALHLRGLVYCDVQPEKIIINEWKMNRGGDVPPRATHGLQVYLARSEGDTCPQTGSAGSERCWEYSAPEQWSGDQVGEGTDVFGAAGVLFYLLSGRAPPFSQDSEDVSKEKYRDLAQSIGVVPGEFDGRIRDSHVPDQPVLSANLGISHDHWHTSLNGLLGPGRTGGLRHLLWMTLGQKQGSRISVHTMKTRSRERLTS
jgi:serine/threonine protein kinase